jgi:2-oxo-4-hydroxy-4-carboxy--5-ureidoimidazoline (OHCU) decarboxylase
VKPNLIPSQLDRETFPASFDSILEPATWIIEKTFDGELGPANGTTNGLFFALR